MKRISRIFMMAVMVASLVLPGFQNLYAEEQFQLTLLIDDESVEQGSKVHFTGTVWKGNEPIQSVNPQFVVKNSNDQVVYVTQWGQAELSNNGGLETYFTLHDDAVTGLYKAILSVQGTKKEMTFEVKEATNPDDDTDEDHDNGSRDDDDDDDNDSSSSSRAGTSRGKTSTPSPSKQVVKTANLSQGNKTTIRLSSNEKKDAKEKGLTIKADNIEMEIPAAIFQKQQMGSISIQAEKTLSEVDVFAEVTNLPSWSGSVKEVFVFTGEHEEETFAVPVIIKVKGSRSDQKLAKVKRVNDGVFAIVRPTTYTSGEYEAITPRFSAYALLDAPSTVKGDDMQVSGQKMLTLQAQSDETIYYTTNSSLVEYIDHEDEDLQGYTLRNDEVDLTQWNEYKDAFTVKAHQSVYAVAVKNQTIGLVTKVAEPEVKKWESMTIQDRDKVFTIRMDQKLDPTTVSSATVYITDENGKKVDAEVSLSTDGKNVTVEADTNYRTYKAYTLHITTHIKGVSGHFLKQGVELPFSL